MMSRFLEQWFSRMVISSILGETELRRCLLALFLMGLSTAAISGRARAEEAELTGPAWILADETYKALGRRDYETAITKAREAVRERPDVSRLKRLLVQALAEAGHIDEAEKAAGDFVDSGETDPELVAQRGRLRQLLARRPAEAAYRALERKDIAEATRLAAAAVDYAPDVSAYRLLLISTLISDRKFENAEKAASDAISRDAEDVVPRVMRGYVRQRLGNRAGAKEDFAEALAQDWLGDEDTRNLRLIVADAAIAAGEGQSALDVLSEVAGNEADLVKRRSAARSLERHRKDPATRMDMPEPFLDCRVTPYGQECSVKPGLVTDPAISAASQGYQAFARRDYAEAIRLSREALKSAPENAEYNALLVNSLAAAGRTAEVEAAVTTALTQAGKARDLYAQRAYARLQVGRHAAAMADFSAALKIPGTNDRLLRLGLADAALGAKQPLAALDALSSLKERSYAVSARRAFALAALDRKADALAYVRSGRVLASNRAERALMIRTEIGLLADLGREAEAAELFADAAVRSELAGVNLDLAYLAVRVKDDASAAEYFSRADERGQLNGTSPIDAAYVAKRVGNNERAKTLMRRAIDAEAAGAIELAPQALFGLRRELAELERSWGFYSGVSYGAVGVMPSAPLATPLSGGNVLQMGSEIYWRPPVIGYRNGSTVELFARAFQTLRDETGGPTGITTAQGAFGARWKPFGSANLVLEISRLFPIGRNARHDTLLRAAYSTGDGTDLRVDVPAWWTWQIYAEIGRYIESRQTIAAAEARFGRSYRLDGISDRLVLTPFVAAGFSYDNKLATPGAFGIGPGINLRYWFREDKYTAPMSYVDFNVQYRFRVAGDKRAQGIFAGITVAY